MKAFNIRERRFLYLDSDFESKFNLFVTKLNFLGNISKSNLVKFINSDFLNSEGEFITVYNKDSNTLYILRKSDGISFDNRVLIINEKGFVDLGISNEFYLYFEGNKVKVFPKGFGYGTAKAMLIDKYLQVRLKG